MDFQNKESLSCPECQGIIRQNYGRQWQTGCNEVKSTCLLPTGIYGPAVDDGHIHKQIRHVWGPDLDGGSQAVRERRGHWASHTRLWFGGPLWDSWWLRIIIRQWLPLSRGGDAQGIRGPGRSQAINQLRCTKFPALLEGLSKSGFPNFSTQDLGGWRILGCEGLFCPYRVVCSISGLSPPDASNNSSTSLITKNASRHCLMSCGGQNDAWLRTSDLK